MKRKILFTTFATCATFLAGLGISSPAKAYNLFGPKWGDSEFGTAATINYSFMPSDIGCRDNPYCKDGDKIIAVEEVLNGFEDEVRKAFDAWGDAANINFVEVADNGKDFNHPDALGDIRIGAHKFDGLSGMFALGFFPHPNNPSFAGDILFDVEENWAVDSIDDDLETIDIFQVASHEIGHAIGLSHTTVKNSVMNAHYSESFRGPQADDIAGAIAVYGSLETEDVPLDVAVHSAKLESASASEKKQLPEPGTVSALFGLSLLGLIGKLWRRSLNK